MVVDFGFGGVMYVVRVVVFGLYVVVDDGYFVV